MPTNWSFYPQKPTDPIRNPIAGEFFSTEAVGDDADALVREGIQNTLDARRKLPNDRREPAKVRIFVSESRGALSNSKAKLWFKALWPHIVAPGNGLREQPGASESCPYIVFEDFGTTGLTGDPAEHQIRDEANNFLNFFRAEGHSDKRDQDVGSWGVGKTVFPRTSRISSFFGLTVRDDDGKCFLLGRSILKFHRVRGKTFKSDGYFGKSRADGFVLPCDQSSVIEEFRNDFGIARTDEPGLSIVVPWYEVDGDDAVTPQKIITAVLRGFFYPIQMGHLSVVVATSNNEVVLNQNSIDDCVRRIGGALRDELLPLLELSEWAQTRTPAEFDTLIAPDPNGSQKWSPDLVPIAIVQRIRESLSLRQRISLRIPIAVQLKDRDEPISTFFNVFIESSDREAEKPLFIRDELIIPDVKNTGRINRTRALVIVEDKPLASMLRDAETPAHTQWNQSTSHFKNKYKFGPGVISYVTHSVAELLRIVNQADRQPDPSLTIDFFSLQSPPDDDEALPARRRRPKPQPGVNPPPPFPPPPSPRPRRFKIDKVKGGFAIKPGDPGSEPPTNLEIRVAYDVRRGNPLNKYHPADVDPRSLKIVSDNESAVVAEPENVKKKGLILQVQLTKPDFHLEVKGFDAERDLYVRANVREQTNDDSAN